MPDETAVVTPADSLYRRLTAFAVNADGTVNSAAFKHRGKPDPQPSVDLARLTNPEKCLHFGGMPELGVGELSAKVPLENNLTVQHSPDLQTGNEAHCLILGNHTKLTCRLLAEATVVIIQPEQRPPTEPES